MIVTVFSELFKDLPGKWSLRDEHKVGEDQEFLQLESTVGVDSIVHGRIVGDLVRGSALSVGEEHPVDVLVHLLKGVQTLKDRCLGARVLALGGKHGRSNGGGEENGPRVTSTCRLHCVQQMVFHLRQLELDLVPVDRLDREVGGIGEQVVVRLGDCVDQDVCLLYTSPSPRDS